MADVEQKAEGAEAVKDNADPKEKAFTHLAQGKRHLLVKDYAEAVASLAVASELLAEVYGEAANECGDAYFNYGRALLGLAREESGVLGDAVEEEPEDSEENEEEAAAGGEKDGEEGDKDVEMKDEEEAATEGEAKPEGTEKAEGEAKPDGTEKADEVKPDGTEKAEGEGKPEGTEKAEGSKGEENGKGDSEEEEDDADTVSNLKLAWEMLELVKIIFQRQADGDKQISLKLAEVYMYLGEIGLESVNYEVAIEDINRCLEIRRTHLGDDDRRVAETLYQLGLAHSLANNFDESIKYFTEALGVLELRVKNLESKKESGGDCSEELRTDAFYTVEGEISELKALLPEIREKIADMEDSKRETLRALFEKRCGDMQQGGGVSSSDGASGSSSSTSVAPASSSAAEAKPVSDISHLIRKKRKLEPDSTDDAKKSKPSEEAAE